VVKVLVLGSSGMIGHQVFNRLKGNTAFELYNVSFRKKLQDDSSLLDARCVDTFLKYISSISPDYIINCIGVLISGSNRDVENAIFLNSYFPHRLSRLADDISAKLIHISTDCVFSGEKGAPYFETDEKDGKGVYAKTKGIGEVISEKHLTLRTSVVGPELKSNGEELFHWFMNQSGCISGYTRANWSGVTTLELAKAVEWSICEEITGLYHITNNSSISKNDLLELFKKHTKKDIEITPVKGIKIDKSFVDTRKLINYKIPTYDEMIFEMVDSIYRNNLLYSQYQIFNHG
jgi:dTDP-4-dehydrorhamnose reductase